MKRRVHNYKPVKNYYDELIYLVYYKHEHNNNPAYDVIICECEDKENAELLVKLLNNYAETQEYSKP